MQFLQSSSVFGNGLVACPWLLHSLNLPALGTFVVARTRHGWAFGGFENHGHTFALEKREEEGVGQGPAPDAAAWVETRAGSN